MEFYNGAYIPKCKNRCFEKLMDEAMAEHAVDGIEPKIKASYSIGSSGFDIYEWSRRLQRHSKRIQGNYISKKWAYCPFCGERLQQ